MLRRLINSQPSLLAVVSSVLLALGAICFAAERGLPVQNGILNFGKVNEGLYRGAQPDTNGLSNLQRIGVRTIINLRMTDEVWKAEEAEALALDIGYTNIPLHAVGRPADEQVRKALTLIETLPAPVFVHCQHGCDRTGTIIACYRIKHDHWTHEAALKEADRYGLSPLERGMREYLREFGSAPAQPSSK